MPRRSRPAFPRCGWMWGLVIASTSRGARIFLLLAGGDKATQARDIQRAKALLKSLPKE